LRDLFSIVNDLKFKPKIHKVIDYQNSVEGLKELYGGKCVGKIVVTINWYYWLSIILNL